MAPPGTEEPDTARCYWAFGVVGVAVAAPSAMLGAALVSLGVPPLAAAAVILAATALLTGGMHQDGLADIADSLGGKDRGHRLAVIRDSGIGSFGAAGLVVVSVASVASMAALAGHGPEAMVSGVVLAACLSRPMMAVQRWLHAPPADTGLARLTGRPPLAAVAVSLAVGFLLAAVFGGAAAAFLATAAGLAVTLPLGAFLRRWIGGVNGDGLGATQQLCEAAMLMLCCALAG